MKRILFIISFLAFANLSNAQFSVDSATNQVSAVEDLFLANGIFVNNIGFIGDSAQLGILFDGDSVNLGVESGIVLSTGIAASVSNGSNMSGGAWSSPSQNSDLSALTGFSTYDLAQLDFDFLATVDSMTFQFVFGSNEYPEWVGSSFNDIFGFFVSGPGITGAYSNQAVNIAVVPGTNEIVSINTINGNTNSNLFIDNSNFTIPSLYCDGYTVPMFATIGGLSVGEAYHITLAIADASDAALDSWVFLGGNSFQQFCTVQLMEDQSRGGASCLLSNVKADFDYTEVCGTVNLENQSSVIIPISSSYYNMGDGNTIPSSQTTYTYATPGNYEVRLVYETADGFSSSFLIGEFPISEIAPSIPAVIQNGMNMIVDNYDGTSYVEWYTSIDGGLTFQEADGVNGPELNLMLYSTFPTHVYAGVSNGCQSISEVVTPLVNVNEMEWTGNGLYPQPAEDVLYFSNAAQKNVSIFNMQGQLVMQGNQITTHMNIESLSTGLYLIQTTSDSINFETSKLIVK
jgi:hypothetical protein